MKNNNLILPVMVFVALFVLPSMIHATTDTIGSGSTLISGTADVIFTGQITATSSGTLQSIGVDMASSSGGDVMLAIYSASGTLIGETVSTPTTTGWEDVSVPGGITITAGTTYYLAELFSSSSDTWYYMPGTGGTKPILTVVSRLALPYLIMLTSSRQE